MNKFTKVFAAATLALSQSLSSEVQAVKLPEHAKVEATITINYDSEVRTRREYDHEEKYKWIQYGDKELTEE